MPPRKTKSEPRVERLAIIHAVRTPLNFFVLVVLVVEGALGGLALKSPENVLSIVYLIVAVLVVLVAAVVVIAFAKPELLFPRNTQEGLPQMRRFSQRIAGHWWEAMTPCEPTAISFVTISPNPATGSVRMDGRAYSASGQFAAKWETVTAWVNAGDRKVFYSWKGHHPSHAREPYEGFGEILFDDSLDSGDGLFFDINLSKWASTQKQTTLVRASKEDLQIMRKGSPEAVEALVQQRIPAGGRSASENV